MKGCSAYTTVLSLLSLASCCSLKVDEHFIFHQGVVESLDIRGWLVNCGHLEAGASRSAFTEAPHVVIITGQFIEGHRGQISLPTFSSAQLCCKADVTPCCILTAALQRRTLPSLYSRSITTSCLLSSLLIFLFLISFGVFLFSLCGVSDCMHSSQPSFHPHSSCSLLLVLSAADLAARPVSISFLCLCRLYR